MMKKCMTLIMIALFSLGLSSQGFAFTNSGTYLGAFSGNDNDMLIVYNNIIGSANYTGDVFQLSDFSFYGKVEDGASSTTEGTGALYLTYETDNKSGTWQTFTAPDTGGTSLDFYSVKAGPEYALYWLDPASDSGTWSTENLLNPGGNVPEISHLSTWTISSPIVPIPSAILLLGTGLVGLVGLRRRDKKGISQSD